MIQTCIVSIIGENGVFSEVGWLLIGTVVMGC